VEQKPFFLMGHSMGGAEAMTFLLSTAPSPVYTESPLPKISGVILESPYFSLHPSSQPSSIVVSVGKLAGRFLPARQMKQKLDAQWMSRDPKVCQEWVADSLCHDTGTLQGMAGMLERGANLTALSLAPVPGLTSKLPCPLLLCHGDGDRVTSFETSKAVYEKLEGEKSFVKYEGAYHKLHAEPEGKGEEVARDVGAWVVKIAQGVAEEEVRRYVAGEGRDNARAEVRHLKL
jgi:acylglycerol lipase